MISNLYHTGYGYMGTDEYVPAGGDNYEIKPDFPQFRLRGEDGAAPPAGAYARVSHWSTYRKQLTVESSQPVQVVLRLMNYPAWQARRNGSRIGPRSDDPTGRMVHCSSRRAQRSGRSLCATPDLLARRWNQPRRAHLSRGDSGTLNGTGEIDETGAGGYIQIRVKYATLGEQPSFTMCTSKRCLILRRCRLSLKMVRHSRLTLARRPSITASMPQENWSSPTTQDWK